MSSSFVPVTALPLLVPKEFHRLLGDLLEDRTTIQRLVASRRANAEHEHNVVCELEDKMIIITNVPSPFRARKSLSAVQAPHDVPPF